MNNKFERFEKIVRIAQFSSTKKTGLLDSNSHPFDERNVHPEIANVSLKLFDDGHYSQATFEAFKYIDKKISKISDMELSGKKLMMEAFSSKDPKIKLTLNKNRSEVDEQMGFAYLFAGSVMAIRNPRGHEVGNIETLNECLDHLSFASFLMRRVSQRISS